MENPVILEGKRAMGAFVEDERVLPTDIGFTPAPKYLVIVKDNPEAKTKGGIYIAGKENDTIYRGTVVACGRDCDSVYRGRRVIFGMFTGKAVKFDGFDYTLVEPESILGFLP